MAKTNYTKVEEALAEGMLKIEVNRLLDAADKNAAAKAPDGGKNLALKVDAIHLQRLAKINIDLRSLQNQGNDPYVRLKIDKAEIKRFISDPTLMTPKDWERIKAIKEQIAAFKIELDKKKKKSTDDDLVKGQIKDQSTKRFNINHKWIPLR